jgi:hypothetical protein
MADIGIKPARKGMNLSHPVGGALPDEGGLWPEDQFTFRRLEDGDVKRVASDADMPVDPDPGLIKKGS